MKSNTLMLLVMAAVLSACASTQPNVTLSHADREHANLLIFRQNSAQATLADAYIARGDEYFAKLGENQYTVVQVDAGLHEFRAKAHASVSFKTQLSLQPEETVCLEARPNHENLHLLVIPFLNALVPSFILEETGCPSSSRLETMVAV
ncbi:MAG: hypothetical protein CME38_08835 [Haliea sp.]|nr:hypothetical protein [Haliea sp.]|tara:strand:+ start:5250 stop:5696 length:447 start_codon:yes stop_codon:yes gene_type:complete